MNDFLTFRKMVSTTLITYSYLAGACMLTFGGIFYLVSGGMNSLYGLLALTVGNLVWRLICENIIVVFSIHELLSSIERNLD